MLLLAWYCRATGISNPPEWRKQILHLFNAFCPHPGWGDIWVDKYIPQKNGHPAGNATLK